MIMKADVYSKSGKAEKSVELPACFGEPVRRDLIKRAVLSDESKEYQPKGAYRWAGLETSAKYKGRKEDFGSLKNRGGAKLPREVGAKGTHGKVKMIPSSVKGRRAHPPKPQKILVERMNKKEYAKALNSAIAATASEELAHARGHVFTAKLPLVLGGAEGMKKAAEVVAALRGLGLGADLDRAVAKTKRLSGIRHTRSKSRKIPKSVLIVVSGGDILKAGRNIPGVDVVDVAALKAKHLAPGTHPGRLSVYTTEALDALKGRKVI
jgi:large subunit ribosomal protein L4e